MKFKINGKEFKEIKNRLGAAMQEGINNRFQSVPRIEKDITDEVIIYYKNRSCGPTELNSSYYIEKKTKTETTE